MGYLYYTKRVDGAVLIITLLLMLVITILGLSIFETSLLQNKMQQNFSDKMLSFQYAENALRLAKKQIESNPGKIGDHTADFSFEIKPFRDKTCQNKNCYLITAIGKKHYAVTTLQELYMVESVLQPDGSKTIKRTSLFWKEL